MRQGQHSQSFDNVQEHGQLPDERSQSLAHGGSSGGRRPGSGGGAGSKKRDKGMGGADAGKAKGHRKSFQHARLRFRNHDSQHDLAALLHRQASFSDLREQPDVPVSRDKLQQRHRELDALKPSAIVSVSTAKHRRQRSYHSTADLPLSTLAFWEELRACVHQRGIRRATILLEPTTPLMRVNSTPLSAGTPLSVNSRASRRSRVARTCLLSLGLGSFGAPTQEQVEAERLRAVAARSALPDLIEEVKGFKLATGKSIADALEEVSRLLNRIDAACDAAFPTVYSTGRLLSEPCDAFHFYNSTGKRRVYGSGGWETSTDAAGGKRGVRSVALFVPEFCSGSVADKSTFVSRLEALRAWQRAARVNLPLLARLSHDATLGYWTQPDLGGALHRTQVSKVIRAMVDEVLPGMLAVWGLNHSCPPTALPSPVHSRWGRDVARGGVDFSFSSSVWLSASTRVAAFVASGEGNYSKLLPSMNLPCLFSAGAPQDASIPASRGSGQQTQNGARRYERGTQESEGEICWELSWARGGRAPLGRSDSRLWTGQEEDTGKRVEKEGLLLALIRLPLEILKRVLQVQLGDLTRIGHLSMLGGLQCLRRQPRPESQSSMSGRGVSNVASVAERQRFEEILSLLKLAREVRNAIDPFVESLSPSAWSLQLSSPPVPSSPAASEEIGVAWAGNGCILSHLARLCVVHGKAADVVDSLVETDVGSAWSSDRWADLCAALPLSFDDLFRLLQEVRMLFQHLEKGERGRYGGAVETQSDEGQRNRLYKEEEALAKAMLALQREALHKTVELLQTYNLATEKGEVNGERLEQTAAAHDRMLSSCKQLFGWLGLSWEFRVTSMRYGLTLLQALRKAGYVRLVGEVSSEDQSNGISLASMDLSNDDDTRCAERVRRMLGACFSQKAGYQEVIGSRDSSRQEETLRGHVVRIWFGSKGHQLSGLSEKEDRLEKERREQVKKIWGNCVLAVEGLEVLQDRWWDTGLSKGMEKGRVHEEAGCGTEAESGQIEMVVVVTVDDTLNIGREADAFEVNLKNALSEMTRNCLSRTARGDDVEGGGVEEVVGTVLEALVCAVEQTQMTVRRVVRYPQANTQSLRYLSDDGDDGDSLRSVFVTLSMLRDKMTQLMRMRQDAAQQSIPPVAPGCTSPSLLTLPPLELPGPAAIFRDATVSRSFSAVSQPADRHARRKEVLAELDSTLADKQNEHLKTLWEHEKGKSNPPQDLTVAQPQLQNTPEGRFSKEEELGAGGSATVWRGFLWKAGGGVEFIAIKEAERSKGREKLQHEANVMAQLGEHKNIVRYYGSNMQQNPYILMECLANGTLRQLSDSCAAAHGLPLKVKLIRPKASKRLDFGFGRVEKLPRRLIGAKVGWMRHIQSTALVHLLHVLKGLEHMHTRGMIHKDVKATNILLGDHGRSAKLADFGETHLPTDEWRTVQSNDPKRKAGFTAGHVAPEFFWDTGTTPAEHAHKMDIWSFGCVAVELLTGHHPETYLFETRGFSDSDVKSDLPCGTKKGEVLRVPSNWWPICYLTGDMAKAEKLGLDYKDHPLLKDIKIHDDLISFLDACFTLEARERASASKLLSMGLMRGAERTPFTAIGPNCTF